MTMLPTNFQSTAEWLQACGKKPGNDAHFSVQLGCDLEEFLEGMACLEFNVDEETMELLNAALHAFEALSCRLKTGAVQARISEGEREDYLDALCDREVTGNGLAFLAGFDKDGADQAVLASNESKLQADGTPVILTGGKIGKSDRYVASDLAPFATNNPFESEA